MIINSATLKRLDWDSNFFGFEVFGYDSNIFDGSDYENALKAAQSNGATLFVYSAPGGVQLDIGTKAIHVDTRHVMECEFDKLPANLVGASPPVEPYFDREPTPILDQLGVMSGVHSRFFFDPMFPRKAAEAMYTVWIRRALSGELGDMTRIARDQTGEIGAMFIGRIDGQGVAIATLMAAFPHMRGQKLGERFFADFADWALKHDCPIGRVNCQDRNHFARSIYERMGWTYLDRREVFHTWLGEPSTKDHYT